MISWQQNYRNEEEQFQELQDQLLQEVPLVETEKVQNEGTIPPVVSTPLTTQPKMPTIVEEPAVQIENQSEVPQKFGEERTPEERWRRLVTEGAIPPERRNNVNVPGEGQSKTPQFSNASGSREPGPVPIPVSLPMTSAPINVTVTPRRINPIPVIS